MDSKFTITKLGKYEQIYHAKFVNQYELTSTLIRMQEFYESDNASFRNHWFTLDEYMDWYASTHAGKFTYFEDWNGFNIPGAVIEHWYDTQSEASLRHKEFVFVDELPLFSVNDWYLIATHVNGSPSTFEHEIAHALWYSDKEYRNRCLALLEEIPSFILNRLTSWLKAKGYCDEVISDEMNAYLSTSLAESIRQNIQLDNADQLHSLCTIFRAEFDHYNKGLV